MTVEQIAETLGRARPAANGDTVIKGFATSNQLLLRSGLRVRAPSSLANAEFFRRRHFIAGHPVRAPPHSAMDPKL